jgi:hypothetical protein
VWILLLGVVVICAFLPRRRFLVSWSFAVIPVAAMGLCALPRGARAPALWAVVAFGLALSLRTTEPNRIAEREVGKYLAARLSPGQQVSGDMTRVIYYAGRRPLTPRRSSIEELVQAALDPGVRYVVLGSRRASTPAVRQRIGAEYAPLSLPSDLEALADDRGILVLQRR